PSASASGSDNGTAGPAEGGTGGLAGRVVVVMMGSKQGRRTSIRDQPSRPLHHTTPQAMHWGQAPTGEARPRRTAAPDQDPRAGHRSRTPEQDTRAAERRTNRRRAYPDGSSVGPRPPHSAPGPLTRPAAPIPGWADRPAPPARGSRPRR